MNPCTGTNCGCTDGINHSPECQAEHEALCNEANQPTKTMTTRKTYEMTEADLNTILDACKPVPYLVIGGPPTSPQENANRAWAELGQRMGFDHMTVEPTGRGDRFFSAVPIEATP